MTSSDKCKWIAIFEINHDIRSRPGETIKLIATPTDGMPKFHIENLDDPSSIIEEYITANKEINDIILDTEKVGDKIKLKGFSIFTPELTFMEAINHVKEKANRFSDYISAIHNIPITFHLISMVKNVGGIRERTRMSPEINVRVYKPEKLDLNKASFKKVYQNNDIKLARQLAHFRRGLETEDIITKIREFYLIVEDEYGKENHFCKKFSYARHLQAHPYIADQNLLPKVKTLLRKDYMDPSNPQDIEVIKKDETIIEKEAINIIKNKL
jgi:hypothetical protein